MFYIRVKNSVLQLLQLLQKRFRSNGNLLQLLQHPFRG